MRAGTRLPRLAGGPPAPSAAPLAGLLVALLAGLLAGASPAAQASQVPGRAAVASVPVTAVATNKAGKAIPVGSSPLGIAVTP